ncbi:MAG TPA: adenosylcobinamide amidohydrolase [Acidimicrobiales bacterium]|jgi:adenosylcobinamide amidohydrolase|nr:adenosylcobinamide amidohydrolase [Acidimicrobiales bacterium]
MDLQLRVRREGSQQLPVLLWRFPHPMRAVASSPHGGGLGLRRWVVNAQVPPSYARRDPDHHLGKLAVSLGLPGKGVGLMTAADVRAYTSGMDGGVEVVATVGLSTPTLAAAPPDPRPLSLVGTINVLVGVPERLSDAGLINMVATVTEAKVQALRDAGLDATGTPTDAVCVVCPDEGVTHHFGGPRSTWGARVARAVHHAVLTGSH